MKTSHIFLALAVVLAPALSAGTSLAAVRVVTTIPDYGALAKEVGGDLVAVDALVKPTQDPHFVDAKPSFLVILSRADMIIFTGMELESGWLPGLLNNARNAKVQKGSPGYLDASTVVHRLGIQAGAVDRALGDIHPGGNPHFWTDPRSGLRIAEAIAERLAQIDSANKERYAANLADFKKRLEAKMTEWNAKLKPLKGTKIVVYHDSWLYFVDWTGFSQTGTLEPKPGVPPSPDHIAKLIGDVKKKASVWSFRNPSTPRTSVKFFAQKTGAELLVLPSMVGAAPNTDNYIGLVDRMVGMIVGALS
ncbi:MAG: metal ABC transporter substrate-binding protein [Deltaproteobacteria bacterium]|nr:metal ABC transporter substrate-binding protein [Deltaproteobacteria bacterium]